MTSTTRTRWRNPLTLKIGFQRAFHGITGHVNGAQLASGKQLAGVRGPLVRHVAPSLNSIGHLRLPSYPRSSELPILVAKTAGCRPEASASRRLAVQPGAALRGRFRVRRHEGAFLPGSRWPETTPGGAAVRRTRRDPKPPPPPPPERLAAPGTPAEIVDIVAPPGARPAPGCRSRCPVRIRPSPATRTDRSGRGCRMSTRRSTISRRTGSCSNRASRITVS